MTVQPEDILKLDKILKPCVELTSLSLELLTAVRNVALRQKLANDVSLLIGHHPTLKRLVLDNFEDLLVGCWDKNRLPTSLETLELYHTILMRVDLEHGTDTSTTSHIRDLSITSFSSPSDIEGHLKFVESHAETLVSLHINFSWGDHQPTVDRLKRMAKRLAKFNKLQRFTYHVQNVDDILEMLLDVMPLIESLNSYHLSSDDTLYDRDFLQSLQLAMKKTCIGRKGLLDFATVIFYVGGRKFQDGIPIVEYEELSEVLGCHCHLRDSYYCEYAMDDLFMDDFEDDLSIGECEDLCEELDYQCQLPDNYDCEQDMDDFPLSKYEAAFILTNMKTLVGYRCHMPDNYDCDMDADVVCD